MDKRQVVTIDLGVEDGEKSIGSWRKVFFFFFFRRRTAYEIRLSLLGSEMCI